MDLGDYRRSDNMQDAGTGSGGRAMGGAVPIQLLFMLVQFLGWKKTAILGAVLSVGYMLMPASVRSGLLEGGAEQNKGSGAAPTRACELSPAHTQACDFTSAVLASTEDVWSAKFLAGELPSYGSPIDQAYQMPMLVVFNRGVSTGGCGPATSDVGPFYCPADKRVYIDPGFYGVMEKKLKAPGDFAQAYVIAHEVGHHIQNLIGSSRIGVKGETENQTSVRRELQADCLAGVWGHKAQASLSITEADLGEALGAAHAIGDDKLGHSDEANFTHGSSDQRKRWFRRGFEKGDARKCDTFSVEAAEL